MLARLVRSRVAFWLLPPALVILGLYYVSFVDETNYHGYWTSVASNSGIFLLFSCTVASVSAAVEMTRLKRSGCFELPSARGRWIIVLDRLWPSYLVATIVQLAGFTLLGISSWGSPGGTPPILWVSFACVSALHVALGGVIGRFLPLAAAAPLALLASYAWLGFTWSVSYFPLRYLSGLEVVACCRLDIQLDPVGPLATSIFSASLVVTLLYVAVARWRRTGAFSVTSRAVALTLLAGLGTTAALFVAKDLGPGPVQARSQQDSSCTATRPAVCLFPEQVGQRDPTDLIVHAAANLARAGIDLPSTVRFAVDPSTPDTVRMAARAYMTPKEVLYSFTSALTPQAVYCDNADEYRSRQITGETIRSWLLVKASNGIAEQVVPANPAVNKLLQQLQFSSPDVQSEWVTANLPRIADCAATPTEVPNG